MLLSIRRILLTDEIQTADYKIRRQLDYLINFSFKYQTLVATRHTTYRAVYTAVLGV